MGRPSALPPASAPGQQRVPVALRLHGACSTALVDPDIFFEEQAYGDAQAVCARCPVAGICLEYALGSESDGVWGGTTPAERQTQRGNVLVLSVETRRAADELDASLQMRTQQDIAGARGTSVRTVERWVADRRQSRAA